MISFLINEFRCLLSSFTLSSKLFKKTKKLLNISYKTPIEGYTDAFTTHEAFRRMEKLELVMVERIALQQDTESPFQYLYVEVKDPSHFNYTVVLRLGRDGIQEPQHSSVQIDQGSHQSDGQETAHTPHLSPPPPPSEFFKERKMGYATDSIITVNKWPADNVLATLHPRGLSFAQLLMMASAVHAVKPIDFLHQCQCDWYENSVFLLAEKECAFDAEDDSITSSDQADLIGRWGFTQISSASMQAAMDDATAKYRKYFSNFEVEVNLLRSEHEELVAARARGEHEELVAVRREHEELVAVRREHEELVAARAELAALKAAVASSNIAERILVAAPTASEATKETSEALSTSDVTSVMEETSQTAFEERN